MTSFGERKTLAVSCCYLGLLASLLGARALLGLLALLQGRYERNALRSRHKWLDTKLCGGSYEALQVLPACSSLMFLTNTVPFLSPPRFTSHLLRWLFIQVPSKSSNVLDFGCCAISKKTNIHSPTVANSGISHPKRHKQTCL